jgi:HEAT repeat protein
MTPSSSILWAGATVLLTALALAAAEPASQPVAHTSLRAASEAAAADQSLVLLIFSAEWCGPCKELKASTLAAPEFTEHAGLLHLVDVDVDSNQKLAASFAVQAIPALMLLTGDGKIVGRHTGFVAVPELLAFIAEGRRRAKAGEWDGTAPADKFADYAKKAAADELTTNDLHKLVDLMGQAEPADRAAAARILLRQREAVVPVLIDAIDDPYLGVRVAAADVLQRLAPDRTAIDPWQAPDELTNSVAALRKWWSDTGKLPAATALPHLDATAENSIKAELETLRGDDPVRRTEAMSALVSTGTAALPAVREALRRAEKSGDQRALGLLEDVRWAMLVPDTMEQRTGGVRQTLARGKSLERQAAAERLGRAGAEALPVLSELANDADGLVAESAVRALSSIGGREAVPAMAALLQSSESNLRMTAAQALGHSKSPEAIKPLLTAVDDPNEVVACAAIAALEENRSGNNGFVQPGRASSMPEEIATGLKRSLADPRWRVRAAAAEAAGKLGANELADDIKKLLDDPDGFVVQNALGALEKLNASPDTQQLAALGKRLPSLRAATVEMMLASATKETAETVTAIFNSGTVAEQEAVLNTLAKHGINPQQEGEADWKPLLAKAISAPDARLRRSAAEALRQQRSQLAAELVAPLLSDEDTETRALAADIVLKILEPPVPFAAVPRAAAVKTNVPAASASRMAAWHADLLQRLEPKPRLAVAAALFATGDNKADLPTLLAALEKPELPAARRRQDLAAVRLILEKLPWPDGRPVLDKLCASPALFAMAAQQSGRAAPAAADYLMEPARFKAAVEPVSGDALKGALDLLAGYAFSAEYGGGFEIVDGVPQQVARGWTLWDTDARTRALSLALAQSTNAAWRAAAVYALGRGEDSEQHAAVFEKALADPNEWVRCAAVQALARRTKERPALEAKIGPLLSETNLRVATAAALALIEPEIRQAAGLEPVSGGFVFEGHSGGDYGVQVNAGNGRPLTPLEGKPPFLGQANKWLGKIKVAESIPFALLLAQYGQFDGLDRLVANPGEASLDGENEIDQALLAGIALSQDSKYLPALRKYVEAHQDDSEWRKVLQALQGMRGAEARQLRLDINKKIRNATNINRIDPIH